MKILVANQKHGDEYYKYSTPEEQAASVLKLFKSNDDQSYYCELEDDSEIESMKKQVSELTTEIDKAVAGDISPAYIEKLKTKRLSYERQIKEDSVQIDLYKKAKAGDSAAAAKLLKLRQDAEYEGYRVAEVE